MKGIVMDSRLSAEQLLRVATGVTLAAPLPVLVPVAVSGRVPRVVRVGAVVLGAVWTVGVLRALPRVRRELAQDVVDPREGV